MTSDLRDCIADCVGTLGRLDMLLAADNGLPAIIAAKALVQLDRLRTDLAALAGTIEDAASSKQEATA